MNITYNEAVDYGLYILKSLEGIGYMAIKNYSPIKKIYIKNSRNIGEATLDFNDSPIISLIGDNEAGKTSVVKAFAVCALHAEPRSQKDYIRDGTTGFGVAIELEDKTIIRRMKTATTNSYSIILPDGRTWELGKTESVIPQPVQDIMGLKEEPETKEYLHIRTYEDRLLFVATPASVNYKVMYDALKIDDITTAIKNGNAEANKLRQEVISSDNGIDTLTNSLRAIKVYDITSLLNIKSRILKEQEQIARLIELVNLSDKIEQQKAELGALSELVNHSDLEINEHEITLIASMIRLSNLIKAGQNQLGAMQGLLGNNIQEISESESRTLASIIKTIKILENKSIELNKLKDIDGLSEIDITELAKIYAIYGEIDKLNISRAKAGSMVDLNRAEEIDVSVIEHLINAMRIKQAIDEKERVYEIYNCSGASLVEQKDFDAVMRGTAIIAYAQRIDTQKEQKRQFDEFCEKMERYLLSVGAAFEVCPNCGEQVLIDIDKYKG